MSTPLEGLAPPTEAPRPGPRPLPRGPGCLPLEAFLESVTGAGATQVATLVLFAGLLTGRAGTSAAPVGTPEPPAGPSAPPPVARLQKLTGLRIHQLAELFSVTRPTIYAWLQGTLPRGERELHLLEALRFAEEAARHFRTPPALRQWLLTPTSPDAATPLGLMSERHWRALRGLLLKVRAPSASGE